MKKQFDKQVIADCIRTILSELDDNPDREGLKETPKRVAEAYCELYEGMRYSNEEIAKMFCKSFEDVQTGELVTVTHIPVFSTCEHHMILMYNMQVHVGYIPNKKVIGLSKIARIADMVCRRLQLQERIGMDIAEILEMVLNTSDIIVVIEGEHGCMTARGIKKPGSVTKTATLKGKFKENVALRQEFYNLL